jgi:hypothetical protein
MKITNKMNLPEPFLWAVQDDRYDPGSSDITGTSLIDSPRIRALRQKYGSAIEQDAADMVYAVFGSAVHDMLERAAHNHNDGDYLVEERLYLEVLGWKLGCQLDLLHKSAATLWDHKTTSTWEYIYGLKPERVNQINVYAYVAKQNGYDVQHGKILMLFKDWSPSKGLHTDNYPARPVMAVDVPMWSDEEQRQYIEDRVKLHQDAEKYLPECSDEERWAAGAGYALMKKGRKSAIKVEATEPELETYAIKKGLAEVDPTTGVVTFKKDHWVHYRKPEYKRCQNYCNVSDFCEQWKQDRG